MMGVGDYKCLSLVNRWHEVNEQEGPAEVIFLVTAVNVIVPKHWRSFQSDEDKTVNSDDQQ